MRISSIFLLFFVVVLGMEPRVLHALGKCSAPEQHLQTFMDYEIDSHSVAQAVLELAIPQPLNLLGFSYT